MTQCDHKWEDTECGYTLDSSPPQYIDILRCGHCGDRKAVNRTHEAQQRAEKKKIAETIAQQGSTLLPVRLER